jgi:hypothetical protein
MVFPAQALAVKQPHVKEPAKRNPLDTFCR